MSKITRYAAFCLLAQAVVSLFILVGFAYAASLGAESEDVAKAMQFTNNQPVLFTTLYGTQLFLGLTLIVVVLGVRQIFSNFNSGSLQFATVAGFISSGAYIINGLIDLYGRPYLSHLYTTNPAEAVIAYQCIPAITGGISNACSFTLGLWILGVSATALRSGRFPRLVNYYGVVAGLVCFLSPVTVTLIFLAFLLTLIWQISIGILLLRSRGATDTLQEQAAGARLQPTL